MKATTEKQMREQFNLLRDKLDEISAKRKREENQKLVGQCFKYHNTYGGGPKWWLYVRILETSDPYPYATTFQKTSMGILEVKTKDYFSGGSSYVSIPRAEYDAAWENFKKEIAKI